MTQVALLSAPWPLFNRPSIQLGTLKAFVRQRLPRVRLQTHHLYLAVAESLGYDLYGQISERTWLSEAPYAALLYPERGEVIERFWHRKLGRESPLEKWSFREILKRLEEVSERTLRGLHWQDYALVGLSLCFGQLTSSLYFIRQIKKRAPGVRVVVGGSACAGDLGRGLLDCFADIDFVIHGEGEWPLVRLIERLSRAEGEAGPHPLPGLLSRHDDVDPGPREPTQMTDLDELPTPDYDDYFAQLRALGPQRAFIPKLPMEISRGCWWGSPPGAASHKGCAFCNLNLQWEGYRAKSRKRVVRELDALTEKYETLSVSFTDNILPSRDLTGLFEALSGLNKDLRLFSEIRATTSFNTLSAMASAGMDRVQVGIEALSTRLLKKLQKGTSTMQNLLIMKYCETPGLPSLSSNLILEFPGSDQGDVDETLMNLPFALPFRPLKGIPFWLGYGSPVWRNPAAYGIKRVHNHPSYGQLFPPEIFRKLRFMIQGYHGGLRDQRRLWRPVREKLEAWRSAYQELHREPGSGPILSYQDGGNFMILRQRQHRAEPMTHRLRGTSRKIYLFCESPRPLRQILDRFPGFGEEKVRPFLDMMVDKRLMFQERERYLSLAVPARGWRLRSHL